MNKYNRNPESKDYSKPLPAYIAKNLADLAEIKQGLFGDDPEKSFLDVMAEAVKQSSKEGESGGLGEMEQMIHKCKEQQQNSATPHEMDMMMAIIAVFPPIMIRRMKEQLLGRVDRDLVPLSAEALRSELIRMVDSGRTDLRNEMLNAVDRKAANGLLTTRQVAREQQFIKTASSEQLIDELLEEHDDHERLKYEVQWSVSLFQCLADMEKIQSEQNQHSAVAQAFAVHQKSSLPNIATPVSNHKSELVLIQELNHLEFLEYESWDKAPIATVFRPKKFIKGDELRRMIRNTRAKLLAIQGGATIDRFGLRDVQRSDLQHRYRQIELAVRSMEQQRTLFSATLEGIADEFIKDKRWTKAFRGLSQSLPDQSPRSYELWLKQQELAEIDFILKKPTDPLKAQFEMLNREENIVESKVRIEAKLKELEIQYPQQREFIARRRREIMDSLLDGDNE